MYIDPDELETEIEESRKSGELSKTITTAKLAYQAAEREGYIEEINRETGDRRIGIFKDGELIAINQDNRNE